MLFAPCLVPGARALACLLALVPVAAMRAQASAAPAAAPVVSPEVLPDKRVTFRIAAPHAREVTFKGDWHAEPEKMIRGADGTWSITLGPLAPATYIYGFTVDGVPQADPVNPRIKLRMRTSGSLVEVPADAPTLADARDVPHGAVEVNWHKSAVLGGETREVWVYTPPGYAQDRDRRYPVLYLFHGNNDRPAGWIDVGNLQFIADNLIAEKKMVPMVIVMPLGHVLPFGQPAKPPRTNTVVFDEYLMQDVLPLIEAKYRLAPGRRRAAVAGMSMGGEQALHVFFGHLDRFSAVGAFSPGRFAALEDDPDRLLAEAAALNARTDVLWIGAGRQEPANLARGEKMSAILARHRVKHTWYPSDGAHHYALWRRHLIEFLPLLFRAE